MNNKEEMYMNQNRMPLYEALMEFKERRPLSFHVPGHKNGLNFPKKASGGLRTYYRLM